MASERRTCPKPQGCGRKFSRPLGSRRLYCETCRPPRKRAEPLAPVIAGPGGAAPIVGPLEAATLAELEEVGRQSMSAGVEALHLARLQDAGGHTAQGAAALAKARREAFGVAMAGAKVAEDALDELRRRRLAKAAGA